MNHKIQEYADQCWKETMHYTKDGPVTQSEFDYNKFARLIITECCSATEGQPRTEIRKSILNHFGLTVPDLLYKKI